MARKRIETEPATAAVEPAPEPAAPSPPTAPVVEVAVAAPVEPATWQGNGLPHLAIAEPTANDTPALPAAEPAPPGWSFREPVFGLPVTGIELRPRGNGASMTLNLLLVDPPGRPAFLAERREVLSDLEARIAGRVRDTLDPKALANFAALRQQLQEAEQKAAQADADRLVQLAKLDSERQEVEASSDGDIAARLLAIEDAAAALRGRGDAGHRAIERLRQLLEKRREGLTRDIMAAQAAAEREERQRLKGERAALYAKIIGDGRALSDLANCETAMQRLLAPHALSVGSVNALLGVA